MKNLISRFVKDESGATAIEYGLIAAGISLAIIAVVNGLGSGAFVVSAKTPNGVAYA
jgi:pilus assembly protein Flp/PilA